VPRQRKIVYVEDNTDARTAMAELLRMLGYEVIEVADGASVLPAALAAHPDAVLRDIGLPDIDGYAAAMRLRAHPLTQFIPVIALTGYGQPGAKQTHGSRCAPEGEAADRVRGDSGDEAASPAVLQGILS